MNYAVLSWKQLAGLGSPIINKIAQGFRKLRRPNVAKRISWALAGQIASRIANVGGFLVISKFVSPSELGHAGMVWLFISVAEAFSDFGVGPALVRKVSLSDEDVASAFYGTLALGFAWALAAIIAAPIYASVMHVSALRPLMTVTGLLIPIQMLGVAPSAILNRELRVKDLALRDSVASIGSNLAGVAFAMSGWGAWSIVGKTAVGSCVSVVLLWRATGKLPLRDASLKCFVDLLRFGCPLTISGNLGWISVLQVEQWLVAKYLGAGSLGLLSLAKRPIDISGQIISNNLRNTVLFPMLARQQNEIGRLTKNFFAALYVTIIGGVLVATIMYFLLPTVITSIWSKQWWDAVPVAQVLIWRIVILSSWVVPSALLMALGRSTTLFKLGALSAVANIAAMLATFRLGLVPLVSAQLIVDCILLLLIIRVAKQILRDRRSQTAEQ